MAATELSTTLLELIEGDVAVRQILDINDLLIFHVIDDIGGRDASPPGLDKQQFFIDPFLFDSVQFVKAYFDEVILFRVDIKCRLAPPPLFDEVIPLVR